MSSSYFCESILNIYIQWRNILSIIILFYTILHPFLQYLSGYFKPFLNLYLHIKFIQNAMQILSIRNTII